MRSGEWGWGLPRSDNPPVYSLLSQSDLWFGFTASWLLLQSRPIPGNQKQQDGSALGCEGRQRGAGALPAEDSPAQCQGLCKHESKTLNWIFYSKKSLASHAIPSQSGLRSSFSLAGPRPHSSAHGSRPPQQPPPGGNPTAAAEQRGRSQHPQPGERPGGALAAEWPPGRSGQLTVCAVLCTRWSPLLSLSFVSS